MRRILIVDDETNIRLGLQSMIEREYPGQYELTLASDALEALEHIRSAVFDMMLTDISMPEMDGIGLIQVLQSFENRPLIVIVSGYDDFAYAKAAIRYEVREYLLKPVIREELAKTINRLEEELLRREEVREKLVSFSRQRTEYQESQLNYYSAHPAADQAEVRSKLAQLELQWLDHGFRLIMIKYAGDIQAIGMQVFKAQVEARLDAVLPVLNARIVHFFDRGQHAVILVEGAGSFEIPARLLAGADPNLIFSVSGPGFGMEVFPAAYEEAALAMKYTFMRQSPGMILFDDIRDRSSLFSIPADRIRMIANMLGSGREKEMLKMLHEVMDFNEIHDRHIGYLEAISQAFNKYVFDHVFQMYGKESVDLLKHYKAVGNPYNFTYFHEYVREVESLIMLLNDYVKTLKSVQIDNKEMKAALKYIHENYTRSINMTIISNVVSFNYSYFSQAFREYTGENFVNYLKKFRIGKAKELLETTDAKIFEIAQKVGFENTKNFNRVFKESEGVSPMEYRNQRRVLLTQKDAERG